MFRVPAILSGVATVVLGAVLARRLDPEPGDAITGIRGSGAALAAAFLLGGSYLFVHYSSEARGHALATAFSFLALVAASRGEWKRRSPLAPLYWAAVILGILGHLLAIHVFAGAIAWSFVRWRRQALGPGAMLEAATWWHAVPGLAIAAYTLGFLRHVVAGGGPTESLLPVLGRAVAYALGLPLAFGTTTLVLVSGLILAAGVIWLWRGGSDAWALYLVGILVSPLLVFARYGQTFNFERYFLVNLALLLVLTAQGLAALATTGRRGAIAASLLAALFAAGNVPRIAELLQVGRGSYPAVLTHIADETPGNLVRLSSDHEGRHGLMLAYYVPRLPSPKAFAYVSDAEWASAPPDWMLFHRFGGEDPPAFERRDPFGNTFVRESVYPSAPLSGWTSYAYRRVAGTDDAP